jgi:hypothetical protein
MSSFGSLESAPTMSSQEDYDKASAHCDCPRWPIDAEIIVGCLAQDWCPWPG